MRLNALTIVVLALALLSPGRVSLAASHTSHRTAARKTSSPAKQRKAGPATAKRVATAKATPARSSKHAKSAAAASVKTQRVNTQRPRKGHRHSAAVSQISVAANRKATSSDFVKAAGGNDGKTVVAANKAQAQSTKLAAARASDLAGVSKPAAVAPVSVTQTTSVNPKLETVEQEAATPVILPALYNKRGRLIVPPPLRGSHEILVRQNVVADRDGLDRIQDDTDLNRMRTAHMLAVLPESSALSVDDRLPANRRYARPWTVQFLVTLSRAHYARFHSPLIVTSAVRTVEFQQKLQRTNGNAAPAEGETASPHLTGQAIDLGKKGLSITEIAWLRGYLLPLSQQGRIDVEEEFQQACFHISVYKKYLHTGPKREIAGGRHGGTTSLAAGIN
jgi:hypothetical protein